MEPTKQQIAADIAAFLSRNVIGVAERAVGAYIKGTAEIRNRRPDDADKSIVMEIGDKLITITVSIDTLSKKSAL